MAQVYVQKLTEDGLGQEEWSFWLNDTRLVFDSYSIGKRETKRHKFKSDFYWSRLDNRRSNMEKPELPEEVKKQAIEKLMQLVTVVTSMT